ncbi:MAG TPA: hypothetical protein DDY37_03650 [Legionella sp.]|nr:hypothetical protein [Legionella sp.]
MLTSDKKKRLQTYYLDKSSTGPTYFKDMVKLLCCLDTDSVLTEDAKKEIWGKTNELYHKRLSIYTYLHDVRLIMDTQRLPHPIEQKLDYGMNAFFLGALLFWLNGSLSTIKLVGLISVGLLIASSMNSSLSPARESLNQIDSVIKNEVRTTVFILLFQHLNALDSSGSPEVGSKALQRPPKPRKSQSFFNEFDYNMLHARLEKMQQDIAIGLCFKPRVGDDNEYEKKFWDVFEQAIEKATGERPFTPNYSNTAVEEKARRGLNYLTGSLSLR